MKIIVSGAAGHMGQIVSGLVRDGYAGAEPAAYVSPSLPADDAAATYPAAAGYTGPADCVVDFSNHAGTEALLAYCVQRGLPVVIATTGHTQDERDAVAEAAKQIPVFFAANTSVGIAVLADIAVRAASMFQDADIEIVELHHKRKQDVPSGTALLLANRIREVRPEAEYVIGRHENGKRRPNEIGIHSLRLGNEVGTHEIYITTGSETLVLRHSAENRALFAEGALKAAAFLQGKPAGLYTMQDMLAQGE